MTRLLIVGGSDAGIAAALFQRTRVAELNDLDLSYTLPLGSPWDPVQNAAHAGEHAAGRGVHAAGPAVPAGDRVGR